MGLASAWLVEAGLPHFEREQTMKILSFLFFYLLLVPPAWSSPDFEGLLLGKSPEGEQLLDGAKLNSLLNDLGVVGWSARIVPHYRAGQVEGFKIFGIRKGSLFEILGLKSGDIIKSLNGQAISSPKQAIQGFEFLKKAQRFELGILRRGQGEKLRFKIKGEDRLDLPSFKFKKAPSPMEFELGAKAEGSLSFAFGGGKELLSLQLQELWLRKLKLPKGDAMESLPDQSFKALKLDFRMTPGLLREGVDLQLIQGDRLRFNLYGQGPSRLALSALLQLRSGFFDAPEHSVLKAALKARPRFAPLLKAQIVKLYCRGSSKSLRCRLKPEF